MSRRVEQRHVGGGRSLLGPEHARGVEEARLDVARDVDLGSAEIEPEGLERPPAAVNRGGAADGDDDACRAGGDRGTNELPRPMCRGADGIIGVTDERETARASHLHNARLLAEPPLRVHRVPEGARDRCDPAVAADRDRGRRAFPRRRPPAEARRRRLHPRRAPAASASAASRAVRLPRNLSGQQRIIAGTVTTGAREHTMPPVDAPDAPIAEFGFPGPLRDRLVAAILSGAKTSTTGLYEEYRREGSPIETVGSRSVVVDSDGRGVALIETTAVEVKPMGDVDLAFAIDEGEGFETLGEWKAAHVRFFSSPEMIALLGDPPVPIDDGTLVVCSRFRLVERFTAGT